jgi:hypothetical protein
MCVFGGTCMYTIELAQAILCISTHTEKIECVKVLFIVCISSIVLIARM